MPEGLQITVQNYSKKSWSRNNWHVGAGSTEEVNWVDEVTKTPSESLAPGVGMTSAAANSEHLSFLVKDALWMQVGYGCDEGDFAVGVQQYFHLGPFGSQCEWHQWEKDHWTGYTSDANSHTWTFASCKVVATPELSSSGASVGILITNL